MNRKELKRHNILQSEIAYLNAELERLDVRRQMPRTKELKALIAEKLNDADAEYLKIEKAINTLSPLEQMVIRMRYIKQLKVWQIAIELSYAERTIYAIEESALEKLSHIK